MAFDVVFMLQHYVFYRNALDERTSNINDEPGEADQLI